MKKQLLIFILLTVVFCGFSQNTDNSKYSTSNDELLNLYFGEKGIYGNYVEDYFKKPKIDMFKMSPDGLHLSFLKTDYEGKKNLFVKNTQTEKITRVVDAGSEIITEYHWIDNKNVVYLKTKGDIHNYELYSISISGRYNKCIMSFKNQIPVLVNINKGHNGSAIIKIKKKGDEFYKPYKININTGELKSVSISSKENNEISKFIVDNNSILKGYIEIVNLIERQLYYRVSEDKPFEKKLLYNWKTHFKIIDFDYTTPNPNDVLVLSDIKNNTDEILRYDLEKDIIIETIYTNKNYDISGIRESTLRNYEVDFYYYTSDKIQIVPVSKHFKKIDKKIKARFSGKNYTIISTTKDERKYLIYIKSDVIYGKYFLYDVVKDEFKFVMNTMIHLKESEMVKMNYFKFKSRDGLTIHCYLTLPSGAIKGSNTPLIVIPHEKPYVGRDVWDFDREAQLFASRGYATLRVNYRGSEGYGTEFRKKGHKQLGRKITEDIEDAVYHVIKKGMVNKQRIAIYGKGTAGLMALQSIIKNPSMFTCAVNKFGPCSIITSIENTPESSRAYLPQYYELIYDITDKTERQIAIDVSPLHNIDKIKKPIFIIESTYANKNILDDAEQLITKLKSKNIDSYYVIDHNHNKEFEKSEIEYYKSLLGFFSKYLGK